jgi:hypothetical protein
MICAPFAEPAPVLFRAGRRVARSDGVVADLPGSLKSDQEVKDDKCCRFTTRHLDVQTRFAG